MVTLIMSKFSLVGAESTRVKLGTPTSRKPNRRSLSWAIPSQRAVSLLSHSCRRSAYVPLGKADGARALPSRIRCVLRHRRKRPHKLGGINCVAIISEASVRMPAGDLDRLRSRWRDARHHCRLIGQSLSQRLGQSLVIDKDHERRRERMPEVQGAGHQVAPSRTENGTVLRRCSDSDCPAYDATGRRVAQECREQNLLIVDIGRLKTERPVSFHGLLMCMREFAARRAKMDAVLRKNHMGDAAARAAPKSSNR
jgi:hypothetical protein